MPKTTDAAAPALEQAAAETAETSTGLPLMEPARQQPEERRFVGVFNPNPLEWPTANDLVAILMVLGISTRVIAGEDKNANLLDAGGNVVIPAPLRRFFNLVDTANQG
jgi:hypothetical protein